MNNWKRVAHFGNYRIHYNSDTGNWYLNAKRLTKAKTFEEAIEEADVFISSPIEWEKYNFDMVYTTSHKGLLYILYLIINDHWVISSKKRDTSFYGSLSGVKEEAEEWLRSQ